MAHRNATTSRPVPLKLSLAAAHLDRPCLAPSTCPTCPSACGWFEDGGEHHPWLDHRSTLC